MPAPTCSSPRRRRSPAAVRAAPARPVLARLGPVLLTALLAPVVLTGCGRAGPASPVAAPEGGTALPATIAAAIDGDTVDLRFADGHQDRARLLGIDTPETVKPDHPVDCFGPEASNRTKSLLPAGTAVLVQRDEEARDRYGRLLVYLWRRADGLFVNRSLVVEGYADTLSIAPNTAHEVDLSAAAALARAEGRGLWGRCGDAEGGPAP
jgi:micrococcal nuclease